MSAVHSPRRKLVFAVATALALALGVTACSSNAPSSSSSDSAGAKGGTLTTQFAGVPISLIPDLATKWALSDGNTKLTLTLRSGVKFTDGATMDADAVKASLEYFLKAGG